MSHGGFDLEARLNVQDGILREQATVLGRLEESVRLLRQELLGNGQPGRLALSEKRIQKLELQHEHARGYVAGIATLGGAVGAFLSAALIYVGKYLLHIK